MIDMRFFEEISNPLMETEVSWGYCSKSDGHRAWIYLKTEMDVEEIKIPKDLMNISDPLRKEFERLEQEVYETKHLFSETVKMEAKAYDVAMEHGRRKQHLEEFYLETVDKYIVMYEKANDELFEKQVKINELQVRQMEILDLLRKKKSK